MARNVIWTRCGITSQKWIGQFVSPLHSRDYQLAGECIGVLCNFKMYLVDRNKGFDMGEKVTQTIEKREKTSEDLLVSADSNLDVKDSVVVLAVGDVANWRISGRRLPWDSKIVFVDYHHVNRELIDLIQPAIVLSPLLCHSFDCLDLAQTLEFAGFHGRYRIMSPILPKPQVVLDEMRWLCPGMNIGFIFDHPGIERGVN